MGVNSDPVTLHKYAYANLDPVNNIDPSGNFSIGSLMAGVNIRFSLSSVQINIGSSLLDAALDPDNAASNAGTNALLGLATMGGPTAFKLLGMLSKKFRQACNSFSGDTLVSTEHGLKPISKIEIGEMVWAYNEDTGEKSLQEVVHLIEGEGKKQLVDIELSTGEVLTATAGHPLYLSEIQFWRNAGDLVKGDSLLNLFGDILDVESVTEYSAEQKVHNLTVINDHTYFVGQNEVLSHNASLCKPIGRVNLRHIMSGDRFGGGHSVHGSASNVLREVSPRYSNGVYRALVRNPVDGVVETKTFFPDSWDAQKIKTMINAAYIKYSGRGGRSNDFTQWVNDGNNLVELRVVTRVQGDAVEVLTAHPIYRVHP